MTPNGAAITAFRKKCGLSQRRLARLIGRSNGFLNRIEADKQGAGVETLQRIAEELHVPIEAITREKPRDQD